MSTTLPLADPALSALMTERSYSAAAWLGERLIAAGGVGAKVWEQTGEALERLHRDDAALALYRAARAAFPRSGGLALREADLLSRTGRIEAAETLYRDVITRHADHFTAAVQGLLDCAPLAPEDPLAARLATLAQDGRAPQGARVRAWFQLGRIAVEAGRDAEGFAHYAAGNRLKAEGMKRGVSEHLDGLDLRPLDTDFFARFRRAAPIAGDCPALFVGGLPRSGKTLTESLLSREPDLVAGGEVGYLRSFGGAMKGANPALEQAEALRSLATSPFGARYAEFLSAIGAPPGARIIDTFPANLKYLGVLALLHPEAPVVLCRRNALDLGVSLFFKNFADGHSYTCDLATIGRALARSEHAIAHWDDHLPNPLVVVDYERLVTAPDATVAGIRRRLGLAPAEAAADQAAETADWRVFPSRSVAVAGRVSPGLIGFADRFAAQIAPMREAYAAEWARLALSG